MSYDFLVNIQLYKINVVWLFSKHWLFYNHDIELFELYELILIHHKPYDKIQMIWEHAIS